MIRIITDSTSDISISEGKQMGVGIVPLTVNFGEVSYKDGVEISNTEFYERLIGAQQLPTTSQPSPEDFLPLFEEVKAAGDSAVVITLTSQLSGTYQSAMIAKQLCEYEHIHIVDSTSAAVGIRILVNEAIKMRELGMGAEEIAKVLRKMSSRLVLYVMVDTLDYLYKGGRLSKTVKIAGGLLGFKPILTLKDGMIELKGTGRGSKQAIAKLLELTAEEKPIADGQSYYFGYTHIETACDMLRAQAKEKFKVENEQICPVGCAIGTHVGPGASVIAYLSQV